MIEARGVSVQLGERLVLDDVDVTVAPGELVAVIGANGAGKSTLLRAMAGDIDPQDGRVELDGRPVGAFAGDDRARRLSWMGPDPSRPVDFTVREVVTMGRHPYRLQPANDPQDDDRRVEEALATADLVDLADHLVHTLSTGEAQRTSFARLLAQATPVVVLDEPTSSLDVGHQSAVMHELRRLATASRAVIAALHDLTTASRHADRIVLLEGGRVKAAGTADEVIEPRLLSEAFGHPIDVITTEGRRLVVPD